MTSVKILIYGKVQGVAFRYHIKELASTLGVNGWVRNRVDGSVEAFFQGEIHLVNQLIDWCHKGPDEALVEKIDISQSTTESNVSGFVVRATC